MAGPYRHLDIEQRGDVWCVRLRNRRLDELQLSELTDELLALVRVDECKKMALCLGPEPPQFLYSVFLARLVSLQRHLRAASGDLVLCELRPELFKIFEACRLDTQFRFARTAEEGCAALNQRGHAAVGTHGRGSRKRHRLSDAAGARGIATLGLAGPAVWAVVRSVFQARSAAPLPDEPRPGQFWLGQCGGEVADDVVLAVKPASFEIHCHGGRAVVQLLLDVFAAKGFEVCSWQDFLLRRARRDSDADPRAPPSPWPTPSPRARRPFSSINTTGRSRTPLPVPSPRWTVAIWRLPGP